MNMRRFLFLLVSLLVATSSGAFAQESQTARPEIGKPVAQASQLLKEKKYKEALEKLAAADAVPSKTAYERYVIEGTRAAIDLNSGDQRGAIKALEAVIATGILSPQDALIRRQALVQLNYQLKDYPATIAAANRYYQQGGTADEPRLLQAQAYYEQSDFANAAKTVRAILEADSKTGKKPDENLLLALASSDFQQKDEAGRIDALKRLVALYPKPQYWVDLLAAIPKQPGFAADRLALDLDRLKVATGAMNSANDYMEAAQLALLAGLPGDAKAFLDRGYAAGVLGQGAQADREKRLAAMVGQQAGDDVKTLAQQASDAAKAAKSLDWEKLGEAYASYGQNDKAIAAYSQALQIGGLPHPGDASLHLGVAYLALGQSAKAEKTLSNIAGSDGTNILAQLWLIHAQAE
jgi:tetratricopeptide (TPR) repeat protein